MKQYRVIFRVLSNGSWDSATVKADSKESAKNAVIDSHGDDEVKIISVTSI